jgi:hypothetical protein
MMKKLVMLVAGVLVAAVAVQAALTAPRDTPQRSGEVLSVGVASNTTIYAGALVARNATGYAVPASDSTNLVVLGRAELSVANTGADGAVNVEVRRGVFRWENGDTFTIADVGTTAVVEDDATVQKAASATHDIAVGKILAVDADGVWVETK